MKKPYTYRRLFQEIIFVAILIQQISTQVVGECTCEAEEEEDRNKDEALKYKLGAIASILVAGVLGVCLPVLGKNIPALRPEKDAFFIIKAFAAGVILATGFIHILPEAFERLTSPCLKENPWGNFPFTGFVAMMAAIGTLMVDSCATSYFNKSNLNKSGSGGGGGGGDDEEHADGGRVHTHVIHDHTRGSTPVDMSLSSSELIRYRVISQVLELGIIVHSVIIGISLGASQSPKTIRPLVAALSFHQFFEGVGLGGSISQAKFKPGAVAIMILFFSLTTPIGIVIGIGISNVYDENSPTSLIVQGIFDAAAAGILIYMSLVDLLSADFMNPRMQSNGKLQLWANISLLLGAGCMSLLAKWA